MRSLWKPEITVVALSIASGFPCQVAALLLSEHRRLVQHTLLMNTGRRSLSMGDIQKTLCIFSVDAKCSLLGQGRDHVTAPLRPIRERLALTECKVFPEWRLHNGGGQLLGMGPGSQGNHCSSGIATVPTTVISDYHRYGTYRVTLCQGGLAHRTDGAFSVQARAAVHVHAPVSNIGTKLTI